MNVNLARHLDVLSTAIPSRGLRDGFLTYITFLNLRGNAKKRMTNGYKFCGYSFECINPDSIPFFYHEIFVAEPYYFQAVTNAPLIIDGGANIGVSLAYFKSKWPGAKIIAFEPHPEAFIVCERNIKRNGLQGIMIHQAALGGDEREVDLNFYDASIMASTVTNRLAVRGLGTASVRVKEVKLSEFMQEPVDFLKLDIEGAESIVLNEIAHKLYLVKNVFIEFHWTRGDEMNKLSECISILEQAGFNLLISSTLNVRIQGSTNPIRLCNSTSSLSIHGIRV